MSVAASQVMVEVQESPDPTAGTGSATPSLRHALRGLDAAAVTSAWLVAYSALSLDRGWRVISGNVATVTVVSLLLLAPICFLAVGCGGGSSSGKLLSQRQANELRLHLTAYREAWREAGHPGQGDVCLRVPVYAGTTAKEAVEEPYESITGFFRRHADLT